MASQRKIFPLWKIEMQLIEWVIFTSFTTGNESTLRAGRHLSGGDQSMIDFSFPLADGDYEWHWATVEESFVL